MKQAAGRDGCMGNNSAVIRDSCLTGSVSHSVCVCVCVRTVSFPERGRECACVRAATVCVGSATCWHESFTRFYSMLEVDLWSKDVCVDVCLQAILSYYTDVCVGVWEFMMSVLMFTGFHGMLHLPSNHWQKWHQCLPGCYGSWWWFAWLLLHGLDPTHTHCRLTDSMQVYLSFWHP